MWTALDAVSLLGNKPRNVSWKGPLQNTAFLTCSLAFLKHGWSEGHNQTAASLLLSSFFRGIIPLISFPLLDRPAAQQEKWNFGARVPQDAPFRQGMSSRPQEGWFPSAQANCSTHMGVPRAQKVQALLRVISDLRGDLCSTTSRMQKSTLPQLILALLNALIMWIN